MLELKRLQSLLGNANHPLRVSGEGSEISGHSFWLVLTAANSFLAQQCFKEELRWIF